tara:strand:- start:2722 stop:3294 length:573 start_codon:yes stop_codon:yes gene_type:complete
MAGEEEQQDKKPRERRAGYGTLIDAMREANRDLRVVIEERIKAEIGAHADESRAGLAKANDAIESLATTVQLNSEAAKEIGDIVRPIPGRLDSVDNQIATITHENKTQWERLNEESRARQKIELELAEARGRDSVKPSGNAAPTSPSFWMSANGRLVLIIILISVGGILTLTLHQAGASMPSLADLLKGG